MTTEITPVLPDPTRELSFGERAVGLGFNPDRNPEVYACKSGFAHVIDQMNELRKAASATNTEYGREIARMAAIAITEAQSAQMWAVKAITWRG